MAKAASEDAGNLSQEWVWGPAGWGEGGSLSRHESGVGTGKAVSMPLTRCVVAHAHTEPAQPGPDRRRAGGAAGSGWDHGNTYPN